MSENRVLSRMFGPKRDEVTGEWRKLHSEELNDMYSSPSIVQVIKSRGMRRAGHVARMGVRRGAYRVLLGNLRERDHLGDPGVDGRIILRWIFRKWYASETWTLSKTNERRLSLFERKVLRCIFGAKQENGHGEKDTTMNCMKYLMSQTLLIISKLKD